MKKSNFFTTHYVNANHSPSLFLLVRKWDRHFSAGKRVTLVLSNVIYLLKEEKRSEKHKTQIDLISQTRHRQLLPKRAIMIVDMTDNKMALVSFSCHMSLWSWQMSVMHCEKLTDQICLISIFIILRPKKVKMGHLDVEVGTLAEAVKRSRGSPSRTRENKPV